MNNNYYKYNEHSKFIEIEGNDKAEFLQALITNDIYKCKNDNLIYSCFLSPQGKFLCDFFISLHNNKYLIEIHEKYFEFFFNKLKLYKLRSKVEFKENVNLKSYIILKTDVSFKNKYTYYFSDPRSKNIGIKIYLNNQSTVIKKIQNLKKMNNKFYKEILIKNLIPDSTDDLIENKSLLLENNFDNINAISWEKGCYIGQEITARMKYRSLLKKKIYVLELISGEILQGNKIIENKIIIGELISKTNNYLLCMLKINLVEHKKINKDKITINSSTIVKFL